MWANKLTRILARQMEATDNAAAVVAVLSLLTLNLKKQCKISPTGNS